MTNHPNHSGQRYDLAFFGDLLMACVPHGGDIIAEVRKTCEAGGVDFEEPSVIEGVFLTNEPRDSDQIVYSGTSLGWLTDKNGIDYRYAVKR